jgi:hypothetical protein
MDVEGETALSPMSSDGLSPVRQPTISVRCGSPTLGLFDFGAAAPGNIDERFLTKPCLAGPVTLRRREMSSKETVRGARPVVLPLRRWDPNRWSVR